MDRYLADSALQFLSFLTNPLVRITTLRFQLVIHLPPLLTLVQKWLAQAAYVTTNKNDYLALALTGSSKRLGFLWVLGQYYSFSDSVHDSEKSNSSYSSKPVSNFVNGTLTGSRRLANKSV